MPIPIADISGVPKPRALGGNGNLPNADFSGAARAAMQPESDADSGLQYLAQGLASSAASANKIGMHLLDAKIQKQTFDVEQGYRKLHDDFQAELEANPMEPEKWVPEWEKRTKEFEAKTLANPDLVKGAVDPVKKTLESYRNSTTGPLRREAASTVFNQTKMALKQRADWASDVGDIEGAKRIIDGGLGKYFNPTEAEGFMHFYDVKGEKQAVGALIDSDPKEAEAALADKEQFTKLPWEVRNALQREARTGVKQRESDTTQDIVQRIQNGEIVTKEQIDEIGGKYIKPTVRPWLYRQLQGGEAFTPAEYKANYLAVLDEIRNLDPNDPERDGKRYDLDTKITAMLPTGQAQEDARKMLDDVFGVKSPAVVKTALTAALSDAETNGLFGKFNAKAAKKGDKEEIKAQADAQAKRYQIQQEGMEWLRKNPQASPEDLQQWLNNRMSKELKEAKGWQWYNPFSWWGSSSETKPDVRNRIDPVTGRPLQGAKGPQPSATSGTAGKVTSYGYPNDPYMDSNTAKKIGAWNNTLTKDSLAISRDVEARFKELGIQPGDKVKLTLANGKTVVRQWDDRTRKDLTGRFDFYHEEGEHPDDGAGVVRFEKA